MIKKDIIEKIYLDSKHILVIIRSCENYCQLKSCIQLLKNVINKWKYLITQNLTEKDYPIINEYINDRVEIIDELINITSERISIRSKRKIGI